jgi:hypothetical protein
VYKESDKEKKRVVEEERGNEEEEDAGKIRAHNGMEKAFLVCKH